MCLVTFNFFVSGSPGEKDEDGEHLSKVKAFDVPAAAYSKDLVGDSGWNAVAQHVTEEHRLGQGSV